MYIFELKYWNCFTDSECVYKIEIDSTCYEITELEVFEMAMTKAYAFCKSNDCFMFDSLSLISC